jgi:hypothetical protein
MRCILGQAQSRGHNDNFPHKLPKKPWGRRWLLLDLPFRQPLPDGLIDDVAAAPSSVIATFRSAIARVDRRWGDFIGQLSTCKPSRLPVAFRISMSAVRQNTAPPHRDELIAFVKREAEEIFGYPFWGVISA